MVDPYADIESFDQIPPAEAWHRRLFGIGHGNFRVTPLQVANTFATLARGGRQKMPRLFLRPAAAGRRNGGPADLAASLATVCDGMSAVVNEPGGTAYELFKGSGLYARGVKVYGKTGSTENPENAWFAGYAEDRRGAKIALAVVVEGGQHGGSDAGPAGAARSSNCAPQPATSATAPDAPTVRQRTTRIVTCRRHLGVRRPEPPRQDLEELLVVRPEDAVVLRHGLVESFAGSGTRAAHPDRFDQTPSPSFST